MSSCIPDGGCSTGAPETAAATAAAGEHTAVYAVAGMTCGHCKATLTQTVGELDGVLSVDVDVAAGRVTVTTSSAPDDARIAEVVGEAGYELTGRTA